MREIGIFDVEKGQTHGFIHVPRKIIGKTVKIFLIEDKDRKSQVDLQINRIENEIRNLEFKRDSLKTLSKIRNKRVIMGIK